MSKKYIISRLVRMMVRPQPTQLTAPPVDPEDLAAIEVLDVEPIYAEPEPIEREAFVFPDDHSFTPGPEYPEVVVAHEALLAAVDHAAASLDAEIGGLCVGRAFRSQEDGRLLIRVEAMIRAEHTVAGAIPQGQAYVTFTPETWRQLVDAYQRNFPEMRLLGWYHSHPGFGVFLSEMDLFIQASFFALPWQVAIVVDPLRRHVGAFIHTDGRLASRILVWDDDLRAARLLGGEADRPEKRGQP